MMKKITAYVNTMRVHWLVEELEAVGIQEIVVTEYFKPLSQISRFELLCEENMVEKIWKIIHRIGTNGSCADHFLEIYDFDPNQPSKLPLGERISPLEE